MKVASLAGGRDPLTSTRLWKVLVDKEAVACFGQQV